MVEFLATNQMFIVMTIVLLIWAGIIVYLVRLDKRVKELEQSQKNG